MHNYISLRLHPGQDLKAELDALVAAKGIEAACVVTCVGSLTRAVLRYANQDQSTELNGHFEIVSLTGTMSRYGSHYHIALSDGSGKTIGAHLMDGCSIYTTAEIIIAILPDVRFLRTFDSQTGYPELEVVDQSISQEE